MLTTLKKISIAAIASLAFAQAQATVVGGHVTHGDGSFVKLGIPFFESTPDNTVGNNTFQNNNLYAFDEGQNIVLPTNIHVDLGGTGGILAAGTVVASHYVFFDPIHAAQEGYVDFDSVILGVITSTSKLAASDFLLNNGVTYLNPAARGLEAGDDVVSYSGSRLFVDWIAGTPGDYVRVLTAYSPAAVPDASGLALLGLGLAALALRLRRK